MPAKNSSLAVYMEKILSDRTKQACSHTTVHASQLDYHSRLNDINYSIVTEYCTIMFARKPGYNHKTNLRKEQVTSVTKYRIKYVIISNC